MQLLGRLAGRGPGAGVARSTHGTSELLLLSLLKNRGRSRFKRRRLGTMDFGVVGARKGWRSMLPSRSSRIDGEAGRNDGGHGTVEKFLEREREVTVRREHSRRER